MEKRIIKLLQIIVGSVGIGFIIWETSVIVALGIFLLIWANNVDHERK